MKVVIIGDIHGRKTWKKIVKKEEDADYFVFLGDYFDPYDLSTHKEMYDNFMEIIAFKTSNLEKVKLLVGNHDLHYICNTNPCSRYHSGMKTFIGDMNYFVQNNLLQLCWEIPDKMNTWCVHAGFTNTWLRNNRLQLNVKELNDHFKEICSINNKAINPYAFVNLGYRTDPYGDNVYQSPLWVRPRSVLKDNPHGLIQFVGHTQTGKVDKATLSNPIIQCDSLAWKQYYVYSFDRFGESLALETFDD